MEIFELSEKTEYQELAIDYFWKCWGNDSNFIFYKDCIIHSILEKNILPKFYIGLEKGEIVGSYALLTNDLISRQDLLPWFACLYVNQASRKKGYAEMLLNHGIVQSKIMGYKNLYLSTDLVNFYERKGWRFFSKGYSPFGEEFRIYSIATE